MLINSALGYAIQPSANSNDGGGATTFSCDLDPPNFDSNSDPDLDSHPRCVQSGYSIITHTISSIPTTTTSTRFSTQTISGTNAHFFESSPSQRGPSYYTGSLFSQSLRSAPNSLDETSRMHSKVGIIGSQPTIYPTQANLDSVLFEFLTTDGFAAGDQRTATVNGTSSFPSFEIHSSTSLLSFSHPVENFNGFPTRTLGPESMDKFREQSLGLGTRIFTETISKLDLSVPILA
ncbi:hypothetical protein K435DRAFT_853704 [Dendrothele bispora CBS 962.96]|uniref:Uncharacterized protein n=1 Tax=Dendrothele bispora (strain CBS 962.96) TaxID=1314807 RepID=A0A4V4HH65_DENBC|nr:hypothetical protein K435DRAFT_853704 [Dendrothele bispora CBS 962.96]